MRILISLCLLCVACEAFAFYQNNLFSSNPYSDAMGGISIYSVHAENPALSALNPDMQIAVSYKNHYWTNELNCWKGSFSMPTPWFVAAVAFDGYGYEHYNRFCASGQLARKLSSSISIGAGVDVHSFYYTGREGRKTNVTVRIGTVFEPQNRFLAALWIDNPFQTGFKTEQSEKEKIPTNILGGFRLFLTEETQWSVEVENCNFSSWRIKTGMEYAVKSFAIRCGVFGMPIVPTIGFGFFFSDFSLDLSAQYHNLLGVSLGCGLKWRFTGKNK